MTGRRRQRGKENADGDDSVCSPAVRRATKKRGVKPKVVYESDDDGDENEILFDVDDNGKYLPAISDQGVNKSALFLFTFDFVVLKYKCIQYKYH